MRPSDSEHSYPLDDAAALVVLLDPRDREAIARACDQLAAATSTDAATTTALVEAAALLKVALEGSEADATDAIDAAGRLLEAAMSVRQDAQRRADAPRDVPAPQPVVASAAGDHEAARLPDDTDVDLLRDFIAESRDYLEGAEAALLALENDPGNTEAINTVFRAFHTIKGTSAFLGLTHVEEFAHQAESLLSAVREGSIAFTNACADLALRSADMLKALFDVTQRATPGSVLAKPASYDDLLRAIAVAESGAAVEVAPAAAVSTATVPVATTPSPVAATPSPVADAPLPPQAESAPDANASVRVRTDRLDRLIDMVGELVIAQAMIAQDPTVAKSGQQDFGRKVAHSVKIVRELQDLSMSMRMVPLKATFQKMVRLTRDAAQRSGKQVELRVDGDDTEIDRNMVDVIADPLVHMVRNAVDHGIEAPDVRVARGKPAMGSLRLSAYHAGGNVVVELHDDGKGLDRERIVRKAIEKGLIASDKGLTDGDVHKLIFAPGFSTNDVVTDLSGRGVGMDVVRRNIESLQGRIDITSEPGRGCKFTVRLPLTLAITDGMSVRVGTERFIIPIVHIQISFRPEAKALPTLAGRGEMVLLRDEVLPMVRLHRVFDIDGAIHDPTAGLLVVTGVGEKRCALLVDELLGQQQVVAKPLGGEYVRTRGIAGGAILGDGRVGLILDVPELMTLAPQVGAGPELHSERRRRPRAFRAEALAS